MQRAHGGPGAREPQHAMREHSILHRRDADDPSGVAHGLERLLEVAHAKAGARYGSGPLDAVEGEHRGLLGRGVGHEHHHPVPGLGPLRPHQVAVCGSSRVPVVPWRS
jgi:hypothetical protein